VGEAANPKARGVMGRVRKRLSPPDDFTEFYDTACKYGWHVYVLRWTHEEQVLLQVAIYRGSEEHTAPSVTDVSELAGSIKGLRRELER
jgi:hypothetical protein